MIWMKNVRDFALIAAAVAGIVYVCSFSMVDPGQYPNATAFSLPSEAPPSAVVDSRPDHRSPRG